MISTKKCKSLWEVSSKIEVADSYSLSLVYTPGVGAVSTKIAEDPKESFELTNRANSYAVILNNSSKKVKLPTGIDAYPFILNVSNPEEIAKIIINLAPTFSGFMLEGFSIIQEVEIKKILEKKQFSLPVFFKIQEIEGHHYIQPDFSNLSLEGSIEEKSIELHRKAKGVIETTYSEAPIDFSTIKHNLIAIVSDGSAVLGLGNIGAEAALPVMEGKSVLFKTLGNVNAIPICLKTQNTAEIIKIITKISPILGGINLEDISAPRCFEIENALIEKLNIPVFHDDQHGTAVVVLAAFINALKLTEKKAKDIKVVVNGAGAGAIAVSKLLIQYGVKNLILCDRTGAIFDGRIEGMNPFKEQIAKITNPKKEMGQLTDIIKEADFFIGLSAGNVVSGEMIESMAEIPVVFALANPVPEIMPEEAIAAGAYIVATGRSDFNNQVNNSLAFPGIFRGVLDCGAKKITNVMKINAAKAIAGLISEKELSPKYIIPHALDVNVPIAVAKAVMQSSL